VHVREPAVSHDVVHEARLPAQQEKPSSQAVSQSSSAPLHTSAGAAQALQVQPIVHVREPAEPHDVVHVSGGSSSHSSPSSTSPLPQVVGAQTPPRQAPSVTEAVEQGVPSGDGVPSTQR
jgi:hypothetical protein